MLAAYQQAARPGAALPAAAAAVAAPAAAPAIALAAPAPVPAPMPLMAPAPLARLVTDAPPMQPIAAAPAPAPAPPPAPEPPDLDQLADYVLERLRHELRDGRERLGFLLDDSR